MFHSFLLLVRGTIARRGPRSLSVVGNQAWNLSDLAGARESGGMDAVLRQLAATATHPDLPGPEAEDRVITLPTGYTLAPWADLQPAGEDTTATRNLWSSSPGSAG